MRHPLRTSLATAALAGALTAALLAPAAGASAAGGGGGVGGVGGVGAGVIAGAGTGAGAGAVSVSGDGRYEGTPVYIGEGLVAVLRNKAEGPEAWIRYVGPRWKPGEPYLVRVMAKLDRAHPTATLSGLHLTLTKANTPTPALTVTNPADGSTTSYPLPRGA
ncbi:hypothetical protein ACFWAR_10305 [Streptomyces sp. NPDC059917]|uniref:hypothetical protein n=1 Tax=Streptomyces sp. NPDC059917 TaxID=3347002 RepID=UPI00365E7F6A